MKTSAQSLVGSRFGKLHVIEILPRGKKQNSYCVAKCDCGILKRIRVSHLTLGITKSCGCLIAETAKKMMTTHGKKGSIEYKSWQMMKDRCHNEKSRNYYLYGARGIKVCDRWLNSFENFLEDMGERPSIDHSLDRIDVNGDYSPVNCKWSTPKEQSRNKRSNRFMTVGCVTLIIADWVLETGIKRRTIMSRLDRGWSPERIISTPPKKIKSN